MLLIVFQSLSFQNILGQNSTAQLGETLEVQTYNNSTLGIKIQYPLNWTVLEYPLLGSGVVITSPLENPTDKFSENVVIQVFPLSFLGLSKNMTKQEIDRGLVENQTNAFELELIGEKDSLLASHPAHEMVFTSKNALFGGEILSKLIWSIKNDKLYIVTITSAPDKFPDYESKFQSMLDSLQIS